MATAPEDPFADNYANYPSLDPSRSVPSAAIPNQEPAQVPTLEPTHEPAQAPPASNGKGKATLTDPQDQTDFQTDFQTDLQTEDYKSVFFRTKLISWYDSAGSNHLNSILLQNNNGPCALIALINTLILSHSSQSNNPEFLSRNINIDTLTNLLTRDEVNLKQLLEVLGDILLTFYSQTQNQNNNNHSDLSKVLQLLPNLHTGLNINPVLTSATFKSQNNDNGIDELALFRSYKVDIVHGWIADPSDYEYKVIEETGSYEDCQNLLVSASTNNDSSIDAGGSSNLNNLHERANLVRAFLGRTATQLTEYGLDYLLNLLQHGSFAVLFRNDHFSTIIRRGDMLYSLITDSGLANQIKGEMVWEGLKLGGDGLFYNGMFEPVHTNASGDLTDGNLDAFGTQEDEDLALAKAIQEQEDADYAKEWQQREEKMARQRNQPRNQRQNRSSTNRPVSGAIGNANKNKKKSKSKGCVIM